MTKAKKSKKVPLLVFLALFIIIFGLWLVYIPLPGPKTPLIIYDSQILSLRSPLLTLVHNAKSDLQLSSFSFDDPSLHALLEKKRSQGIQCNLYYDKRYSKQALKNYPHSTILSPLSVKGLLHEKTALIDNQTLLLSSSNITLASSLMHQNLTLGIYSPELASYWKECASFGSVCLGKTHLDFFRLHLSGDRALQMVLASLEKAKKTIVITMFTFTHPEITDYLIKAKNRGVSVTIFADKTCAQGASFKALKKLENNGINVIRSKGLALLHHKWGLIDNSCLLFGSANWTRAAFTKNHDFLVKLEPLEKNEQRSLKKIISRLFYECQNP